MKTIVKILPGCLLVFALNARADGTNLTAAQAWAALTNFSLTPPPMAWQTNPPTQADLNKFDDQRAAEVAVLADKAQDFYTRFPDSTNVARARVTEIQALQMAVRYGATNRLNDLLAREGALASDTNAPEALRYQLRLDQLGRTMQAAVAAGADANAELEKSGRALVKEFPSGPEGYNILLTLAENGDLLKMHDLAQFMADSGGPDALTDIGKSLLRRLDVVGKPLPIDATNFLAAGGEPLKATALSNRVVLVDFWATWCPICVQAMPELKRLYTQYHTNGLEIVGVNFDDTPAAADRFLKEQELAWPQYFGGYGTSNKYGRDYGTALPYVWLVDKQGIVRDIHGRKDTEAKIQKLLAE